MSTPFNEGREDRNRDAFDLAFAASFDLRDGKPSMKEIETHFTKFCQKAKTSGMPKDLQV
jgi:hypothetical protein